MKKRKLFAEIAEGFEALDAKRIDKRTLRTHAVETKPARFRARVARGSVKKALQLLEKLDQAAGK